MEEALDKFECQIILDDGAQKILNCDLSCIQFTMGYFESKSSKHVADFGLSKWFCTNANDFVKNPPSLRKMIKIFR